MIFTIYNLNDFIHKDFVVKNNFLAVSSIFLLFSSNAWSSSFPACPSEDYFTVVGNDGISYGWFQDTTCVVFDTVTTTQPNTTQSKFPSCPDASYLTTVGADGVSYGWFQDATCVVSNESVVVDDIEVVESEIEQPLSLIHI